MRQLSVRRLTSSNTECLDWWKLRTLFTWKYTIDIESHENLAMFHLLKRNTGWKKINHPNGDAQKLKYLSQSRLESDATCSQELYPELLTARNNRKRTFYPEPLLFLVYKLCPFRMLANMDVIYFLYSLTLNRFSRFVTLLNSIMPPMYQSRTVGFA